MISRLKKQYSLKSILIIFVIAIGIGMFPKFTGTDIIAFLLMGVFMFGIVSFLLNHPDQTMAKILLLAIFLRMALAAFHVYVASLPDSGADAISFERHGWLVASAWRDGIPASEMARITGSYLYSVWIGFWYYLFGRVPLLAQFVNVLFGGYIVYMVYKIGYEISNSKATAQFACLLAAFFPTLNLYSAITMRENLVAVFSIYSVYHFIIWLKKGQLKQVLKSLVPLFLVAPIHQGMVFIGAPYLLFFFMYNPKRSRWSPIDTKTVIYGILIIILFTTIGGFTLYRIPEINIMLSVEYLADSVETSARDRAAYLKGFTPDSYLDLIWHTPIRVVYLFLAPFPWMVEIAGDLFGLLDSFLYFILFVYGIKSILILRRYNKPVIYAMVLVVIMFSLVFAWGPSNYGTALRHRQKIVWLLIAISSHGLLRSSLIRTIIPVKIKHFNK